MRFHHKRSPLIHRNLAHLVREEELTSLRAGWKIRPPSCTWNENILVALKSCSRIRDLDTARMLHASCGEAINIYIANGIINMYAKCGSVPDARRVFERIPAHDLVSWNLLIVAHAEGGEEQAALNLFAEIRSEASAWTFVAAIKASTSLAMKEQGKIVEGKLVKVEALHRGISIHSEIERSSCGWDIFLMNSLLDMYTKCGEITEARRVFDGMLQRDVVSWNILLLGFAENGEPELALYAFSQMPQTHSCAPNAATFIAVLKACAVAAMQEAGARVDGKLIKSRALEKGMEIHLRASKSCFDTEIMVASSLMNMYARSGSMGDARRVFDKMSQHDLVLWNVLIAGYVENEEHQLALDLISLMNLRGCSVTFVAALKACTALAAKEEAKLVGGKLVKTESLEKGMAIHSANLVYESEILVSSTLLNMYAKCGSMVQSRRIFEKLSFRSVECCNAMMFGYVENDEEYSALELFASMKQDGQGCPPDALSFIVALKACSSIMDAGAARMIHRRILATGEDISSVASALVDAYGKCGSVVDAQGFFDSLAAPSAVSWTSLLAGYSRQGDAQQVFLIFNQMLEERVRVDGITFNCILNACAHSGEVDRGKRFFQLMNSPRFGVAPDLEHYTCLIDMLGRANQLEEALQVVRAMPFKPNSFTWMTLLGNCRKWRNVGVGRLAFNRLMENDPGDSAAYLLMSGLYGAVGMWEEKLQVETMRRGETLAWKQLGRSSWIDQTGVVHSFIAGGYWGHPQGDLIRARLKQLMKRIKEEDQGSGSLTWNISEGDKEDTCLCGHSEKLAIVCALINSTPGSTIRITKNLRSCEDCHRAAEVISRVESRKIVLRDANRFHVFSDGVCSCGG